MDKLWTLLKRRAEVETKFNNKSKHQMQSLYSELYGATDQTANDLTEYCPVDNQFKEFIWNHLRRMKDIEFISKGKEQCDASAVCWNDANKLQLVAAESVRSRLLLEGWDGSNMTDSMRQVLRITMKRRGDGITQAELAKKESKDPKTMYLLVMQLEKSGCIVRIPSRFEGNTSQLCIHSHFVSVSQPYEGHLKSLGRLSKLENNQESESDEGSVSDGGPLMMPRAIMRQKVVLLAKAAVDHTIAHEDLKTALKLPWDVRSNRKQLTGLLGHLENEGCIERILVPRRDENGDVMGKKTIRCVRFLKDIEDKPSQGIKDDDASDCDDNNQDGAPVVGEGGILVDLTIEMQIYRLLYLAGPEGLISESLIKSLSFIPAKILAKYLDSMMKKRKGAQPDVHCEFETVGKSRKKRFFASCFARGSKKSYIVPPLLYRGEANVDTEMIDLQKPGVSHAINTLSPAASHVALEASGNMQIDVQSSLDNQRVEECCSSCGSNSNEKRYKCSQCSLAFHEKCCDCLVMNTQWVCSPLCLKLSETTSTQGAAIAGSEPVADEAIDANAGLNTLCKVMNHPLARVKSEFGAFKLITPPGTPAKGNLPAVLSIKPTTLFAGLKRVSNYSLERKELLLKYLEEKRILCLDQATCKDFCVFAAEQRQKPLNKGEMDRKTLIRTGQSLARDSDAHFRTFNIGDKKKLIKCFLIHVTIEPYGSEVQAFVDSVLCDRPVQKYPFILDESAHVRLNTQIKKPESDQEDEEKTQETPAGPYSLFAVEPDVDLHQDSDAWLDVAFKYGYVDGSVIRARLLYEWLFHIIITVPLIKALAAKSEGNQPLKVQTKRHVKFDRIVEEMPVDLFCKIVGIREPSAELDAFLLSQDFTEETSIGSVKKPLRPIFKPEYRERWLMSSLRILHLLRLVTPSDDYGKVLDKESIDLWVEGKMIPAAFRIERTVHIFDYKTNPETHLKTCDFKKTADVLLFWSNLENACRRHADDKMLLRLGRPLTQEDVGVSSTFYFLFCLTNWRYKQLDFDDSQWKSLEQLLRKIPRPDKRTMPLIIKYTSSFREAALESALKPSVVTQFVWLELVKNSHLLRMQFDSHYRKIYNDKQKALTRSAIKADATEMVVGEQDGDASMDGYKSEHGNQSGVFNQRARPKHVWTEEDDSILMHAYTIMKERTSAQQFTWQPIVSLLPEKLSVSLRGRINTFRNSPDHRTRLHTLRSCWPHAFVKGCQEKAFDPQTNVRAMDLDLSGMVAYFQNVCKSPETIKELLSTGTCITLPASFKEIKETCVIESRSTERPRYSFLEIDEALESIQSMKMKMNALYDRPLTLYGYELDDEVKYYNSIKEPKVQDDFMTDLQNQKCRTLFYMVASTPDSQYEASTTNMFMEQFGDEVLKQTVLQLKQDQILASRTSDTKRVVPGKQIQFGDKFWSLIHGRFPESLASESLKCVETVLQTLKNRQETFYDASTEGAGVASLLDLRAAQRVKINFDMNTDEAKAVLERIDAIQGTAMVTEEEAFEQNATYVPFPLRVTLNPDHASDLPKRKNDDDGALKALGATKRQSKRFKETKPSKSAVKESCIGEHQGKDASMSATEDEEASVSIESVLCDVLSRHEANRAMLLNIYEVIDLSNVRGLSMLEITQRLEGQFEAEIRQLVSILESSVVSEHRSLVNKVGFNDIRYVSARFVAQWRLKLKREDIESTVTTKEQQTSNNEAISNGALVPAISWMSLDGKRIDRMYYVYLTSIMGRIVQKPGIYESRLYRFVSPTVTRIEFQLILDDLVRRGACHRECYKKPNKEESFFSCLFTRGCSNGVALEPVGEDYCGEDKIVTYHPHLGWFEACKLN